MKATKAFSAEKPRKQPTCSRCRYHEKVEVRVLQHQCPHKTCCCSNCYLIKKRSFIYRAQKNLDKQEDHSIDRPLSPSGDKCNRTESVCSGTNSSGGCVGSPRVVPHDECGEAAYGYPGDEHQMSATWSPPSVSSTGISKHVDHRFSHKISDFQTLCLTFPDYSPSQLQALFEQCGNDFQRTIDWILMNNWYHKTDTETIYYDLPEAGNEYGGTPSGCSDYPLSQEAWISPVSSYPATGHHPELSYATCDWASNSVVPSSDCYYAQDVSGYSYSYGEAVISETE